MNSFKSDTMDLQRTHSNAPTSPTTFQSTVARPIPAVTSSNISYYNYYSTQSKDSIVSIGLTPPAYLKAFATTAANFLSPVFSISNTTTASETSNTIVSTSFTGNISLTSPILQQVTSSITGFFNPNAYTMTSHIGEYQQWPYTGTPSSYNLYGYSSHAINGAYSYPAITNPASLGGIWSL